MEVHIRPLQAEDAYTSVKWRNDPEVFKYTGNRYDHTITIESELKWINRVIANPSDYRCAIIADGQYVGNIYLTDIKNGRANYHIFIGEKDVWGKGVARKASESIIEYAFSRLKLSKILLKVRPENERACRLYLSLGFKETGRDNEFTSMILAK